MDKDRAIGRGGACLASPVLAWFFHCSGYVPETTQSAPGTASASFGNLWVGPGLAVTSGAIVLLLSLRGHPLVIGALVFLCLVAATLNALVTAGRRAAPQAACRMTGGARRPHVHTNGADAPDDN
jgi:hypothetical protein